MKTVVWFGFVLGALSAAGEVIIRKPGTTVTLRCAASSYKQNLEWRHGNEPIIIENTRFQRKGSSKIVERSKLRGTKLEISAVKEEDAGTFTCETDGKLQHHTLLVVIVSVQPSSELQKGSKASLQCDVKSLNQDNKVEWKRPGGSLAGSNIVQLSSVQDSDEGAWACTFSHEGQTFSEELNIKVIGPTTETPTTVHSQDSNDKPPCPKCGTRTSSGTDLLGVSWWIWVLVGVSCLVVVLLMVAVICFCKRIKRRKRKLQKMKNSRQLLTPKQCCQCKRPAAAAKPQQRRQREKPSAPPLQTP